MANSDVHVSPVGRLVHPCLNVARDYKSNGKFSYDTLFDVEGEEGLALEQLILERGQDWARRAGCRQPLDLAHVLLEATDRDGKPLPDTRRFKFKSTIVQTAKGPWDRKPAFYDSNGNPMHPEPQLGGGTVAQIAFTFYEWVFGKAPSGRPGLTLQPEALRIHELVTGGSGPVDRSFGNLFGQEATPAKPNILIPNVPAAARGGNF